MQETGVPSLGQQDTLEKEMATHSCILAGNPMDREAWWTAVHGVPKRVGYNLAAKQQHCSHD